jgi:hypothetical protein
METILTNVKSRVERKQHTKLLDFPDRELAMA